MLIADLIARRALSAPERAVWEQEGSRHTYAELDRRTDRVARALAAAGLAPGTHVAICAGTGFPYVCAHFGAARAGLVLAHFSPRYTAVELIALLRHSEAALLFFGAEQTPQVEAARVALPHLRCVRLPPAAVAHPPPLPLWAAEWEAWLAPHGPGAATEPASAPASGPALDDGAPFQLLYTSGTTGSPKGALISHRAKLAQGTTHALNLGLVPGDRVLSALPLYHQYAQWLLFVAVPLAGATVVAHPTFEAGETWAALAGQSITHLPLVPTTLYRLLEWTGSARAGTPHLRCIVYGGAAIDPGRIPSVRAAFPGVRLFQGFGQTETGYCLGLHDADHERRPESLGRPDLFSELRLLDAAGQAVPDGAVGEIVARTPYLMNGYHGDPEATAAYFAFGPDWGRTGDLAVRDASGFYTLVGRRDDLVISGGVNIYPAEVERALLQHPAVADAAVFGVPDAQWGQTLVAAVIPAAHAGAHASPGPDASGAAGGTDLPAMLDAHCRAQLAGFKCPRSYRIMTEFPRTPSGKVRKFALRDAWAAEG